VQEQQLQAGLSSARRADFALHRHICQTGAIGGGRLYLASHEPHGGGGGKEEAKQYTLRAESVAAVVRAGAQQEVLAELVLLRSLPLQMSQPCAALAPLLCTFRDERALYWVFSGRALCTLSQLRAHKPLGEPGVLFVVACVTTALDALHAQRVLLRGVTSSTLMVNDAGYVTVVDMRHSRHMQGEPSYSLVGLPQYLAPEQVRGEGHAFAVDWWSLGVLAYELACGRMPFGDGEGSELAVAQAILEHSKERLPFPEGLTLSELARELILSLLDPDPQYRLGGESGAAAVHDLVVLGDIHWKQLAAGTAKSPMTALAADFIRAQGASELIVEAEFDPVNSAAAESWCASDFPCDNLTHEA